MKTDNFTFLCRTKTGFGTKALDHLPFDLSSMGVTKPLVLIERDAHLAGLAKPLVRAFKTSGMTLGLAPPIGESDPDPKLLKELYQIFIDKGFECTIALGTGPVADLAKALNVAVSLGPAALKSAHGPSWITRPLKPLVYIPTGMGTGMEAGTTARMNLKTFDSAFLAPDLAVIDPAMMIPDPAPVLVNAGLTCLSVCCEAHAVSSNPLARAYAGVGISLVMENLLPLLKQPDPLDKPGKKTARGHGLAMTHASIITGIVLASCRPLVTMTLGRLVADHTTASLGQAMAALLPAVLNFSAHDSPGLGDLALPLLGVEQFSSLPAAQRPGRAITQIQDLLNTLYRISSGTLPRTLADAGMDEKTILTLTQALSSQDLDPGVIDLKQAGEILAHALDGRPVA